MENVESSEGRKSNPKKKWEWTGRKGFAPTIVSIDNWHEGSVV